MYGHGGDSERLVPALLRLARTDEVPDTSDAIRHVAQEWHSCGKGSTRLCGEGWICFVCAGETDARGNKGGEAVVKGRRAARRGGKWQESRSRQVSAGSRAT